MHGDTKMSDQSPGPADVGPEEHSSAATKLTLEKAPVHDSWVTGFRTTKNERFFRMALDRVIETCGASPGDVFLDAGCGSGTKSLLLATLGMKVTGADWSEYVLDKARRSAEEHGLSDRVSFTREDLLSLRFLDGQFPNVLCWGVVMHIPDYDLALNELTRVVEPGGALILSEGNAYSVQSLLLRGLKRLVGRQRAEMIRDEIGLQFWEETSSGRLMTRQTNIPALIQAVERRGFRLEKRFAGQFSELYMMFSSPLLQRLVHALNDFWFKRIRTGRFAYGNLLVFRKF